MLPLIDQSLLLKGVGGDVFEKGPTVAIDLSLPTEEQFGKYRKGHRYEVNRAKREGVTCIHDTEWEHFDTFVDIYHETMHRANAAEHYFFDKSYFIRLRELLGDHLHLFVAYRNGEVLSGALFTLCDRIVQYHLAGTRSRHMRLAPSKLVIDTVRLWGTEIGARIFHLGGGLGSAEDSLFQFKAGFSDLRYSFTVWQMVVNQEVYRKLTEQKSTWNKVNKLATGDGDFFPAYRYPMRTVP